ncbi:MAG: LysR family transcriptional regulator [Deltaproteobacteria bacterium]|nr:LysR family transcriptional regulator [Deltaproteobacteria bacterium]
MIMIDIMRQTHLAGIDLNLLVALDALLREQSVTRAATEVGLSQPAMSRALARLRDLFDDPILVRAGHSMVPTPRALEIAVPLGRSIEAIRRTLEPPGDFDPLRARREFALSAVDTTQAFVLPRLLGHLGEAAPGVEVTTAPIRSTSEAFAGLASGDRDLAIGRFESTPDGIRQRVLYHDRIVCLVRKEHPRIRGKLTLKAYLAEAHLAQESASPMERPFTIESLLAEQGLNRRVACTVENLAIAPFVVARTDLLCSAPGRTITPFAEGLGVRILEPPFEAPGFDLHLAWHERNERDPGHDWLRKTVLGLFGEGDASLGASDPSN